MKVETDMSPVMAWVPYGIIAIILVVTRIPQIGIKGVLNVTTAPFAIAISHIFGVEVNLRVEMGMEPWRSSIHSCCIVNYSSAQDEG